MESARFQNGGFWKPAESEKRQRIEVNGKSLRILGKLAQKDISLSLLKLFLEMEGFRAEGRGAEMYSFFRFEALQNLHLGVRKMLKELVALYLSPNSM